MRQRGKPNVAFETNCPTGFFSSDGGAIPTSPEPTEFPPPGRLMSISVRAGEVFANQEKAIHWLCSANASLKGKTPLEAAQTGERYREAEDVLVRIEHGVLG
jgi:hypothetical protein